MGTQKNLQILSKFFLWMIKKRKTKKWFVPPWMIVQEVVWFPTMIHKILEEILRLKTTMDKYLNFFIVPNQPSPSPTPLV